MMSEPEFGSVEHVWQRRFPVPMQERIQVAGAHYLLCDDLPVFLEFGGADSAGVASSVLALANGILSIADIAIKLNEQAPTYVCEIIRQLHAARLLELRTLPGGSPKAGEPASLSFFRRYGHLLPTKYDSLGKFARLNTTDMLIIDHIDIFKRELGEAGAILARSGVRKITILSSTGEVSSLGAEGIGGRLFILDAFGLGTSDVSCTRIRHHYAKEAIRWLSTSVDITSGTFEIGPLHTQPTCECHECLSAKESVRSVVDIHGLDKETRLRLISLLAVVLADCVLLMSDVRTAWLSAGIRRYNLSDLSHTDFVRADQAGCIRLHGCHGLAERGQKKDTPARSSIPVQCLYERWIARRRHYGKVVDMKKWQRKTFVSKSFEGDRALMHSPGVLVRPQWQSLAVSPKLILFGEQALVKQDVSIEDVATLLSLSLGSRFSGGDEKSASGRWTASAGNLGSVLGIFVNVKVTGIGKGIHVFDSETNTLKNLGRVAGVSQIMTSLNVRGGVPLDEQLEGYLILVSDFRRVAAKYGPFAYRLVNFDVGVVLDQISVIARSMGVAVVPEHFVASSTFDDLLRYQLPDQQVAAVLRLGHVLIEPSETRLDKLIQLEVGTSSAEGLHEDLTPDDVLKTLALTHRSVFSSSPSCANLTVNSGGARHATPAPLFHQQGTAARLNTVADVFLQRRSTREYAQLSLKLADVIEIIDGMLALENAHESLEVRTKQSLKIRLLSNRVTGLTPGVYEVAGEENSLQLSRSVLTKSESQALFVQPWCLASPLVFLICTSESLADNECGDYREILMQAGAWANRLSALAVWLHLGTAIVAGIVQDAFLALRIPKTENETALLGVSVGFIRPAASPLSD